MKKTSTAKQRWAFLKETLRSHKNQISQSEVSARSFQGFNLTFEDVGPCLEDSANQQPNVSWRKYNVKLPMKNSLPMQIDVRLFTEQISFQDLVGFNNTGNVCKWQMFHYFNNLT